MRNGEDSRNLHCYKVLQLETPSDETDIPTANELFIKVKMKKY